MKKKDLQDLRTKTVQELTAMLSQKKTEIGNLSLELTTGKHKNLRVVKNTRRAAAQIATVLKEKEKEE